MRAAASRTGRGAARSRGRINPTKTRHGYEAAKGPHLGDLPNLVVPESGEAEVEIFAKGLALTAGKPHALLDGDGAALVVHGGPDDYRTDPAGASGDRIACGVVPRPEQAAAGGTAAGARRD